MRLEGQRRKCHDLYAALFSENPRNGLPPYSSQRSFNFSSLSLVCCSILRRSVEADRLGNRKRSIASEKPVGRVA